LDTNPPRQKHEEPPLCISPGPSLSWVPVVGIDVVEGGVLSTSNDNEKRIEARPGVVTNWLRGLPKGCHKALSPLGSKDFAAVGGDGGPEGTGTDVGVEHTHAAVGNPHQQTVSVRTLRNANVNILNLGTKLEG